jgi:hypothetical protein
MVVATTEDITVATTDIMAAIIMVITTITGDMVGGERDWG